jgi:hypothetical protein
MTRAKTYNTTTKPAKERFACVGVTLRRELLEQIDSVRGDATRPAWIRRAVVMRLEQEKTKSRWWPGMALLLLEGVYDLRTGPVPIQSQPQLPQSAVARGGEVRRS